MQHFLATACLPCLAPNLPQLHLTCRSSTQLLNTSVYESLKMCSRLEQLTLPPCYLNVAPTRLAEWVRAARHVYVFDFTECLELAFDEHSSLKANLLLMN